MARVAGGAADSLVRIGDGLLPAAALSENERAVAIGILLVQIEPDGQIVIGQGFIETPRTMIRQATIQEREDKMGGELEGCGKIFDRCLVAPELHVRPPPLAPGSSALTFSQALVQRCGVKRDCRPEILLGGKLQGLFECALATDRTDEVCSAAKCAARENNQRAKNDEDDADFDWPRS